MALTANASAKRPRSWQLIYGQKQEMDGEPVRRIQSNLFIVYNWRNGQSRMITTFMRNDHLWWYNSWLAKPDKVVRNRQRADVCKIQHSQQELCWVALDPGVQEGDTIQLMQLFSLQTKWKYFARIKKIILRHFLWKVAMVYTYSVSSMPLQLPLNV